MSYFSRTLLSLFDRTEEERSLLASGNGARLKIAVFAIFICAFLAVYLPPVVTEMHSWQAIRTDMPLTGDAGWKLLYEDTNEGCASPQAAGPCPARPENPRLWNSPLARSGASHEERLRSYPGGAYWLGVTLSIETLRHAAEKHAGQLAIGHILAPYKVWVDGELFLESRGSSNPSPIFLPLSARWLAGTRPLKVAIRVEFDRSRIPPDHYCDGVIPGMYSQQTVDGFLTMASFWSRVRPFTLFISYTLISGLFFFFWLPAPQKQEYFYLALFALSSAALQAQSTDFLRWRRDPATDQILSAIFYAWMTGFGFLMALSFARIRAIVFRFGLPLLIFVPPLLLAFIFRDTSSRLEFKAWIKTYGLSSAFLLGGLTCFAQAHRVRLLSRYSRALPVRARRLLLFGLGMVGLGFLYFLQGQGALHSGDRFFWRGFEQFGVILFFASIALREYGEQETRLRKSPVSEYHRRATLPDHVSGALLVADLKNSEPFYRRRAVDDGENLIFSWRTLFYNSVLRQQGLILATIGDEVIAFFPADKCEAPALNAFRAIDNIESDSQLLTEQCRRQDLLPAGSRGFYFRATVCEGDLRPIWATIGPVREAAWEDAGLSSPFVDSARLMDLERQVPETGPEKSLVTLPQELAARLADVDGEISQRLLHRELTLKDKNGSPHAVAVYDPGDGASSERAA